MIYSYLNYWKKYNVDLWVRLDMKLSTYLKNEWFDLLYKILENK